MKKKFRNKIISILLCFMCLFFVGCGDGGPSGDLGDDYGDDYYTSALEGVKVLSRPADYDFKNAVGEFSENYYNLFSANILKVLHDTYQNQSVKDEDLEKVFKDIDTNNGETFSTFGGDEGSNKYYLFDSIRYKITEIETGTDRSGNDIYNLTLDLNQGWNWNIDYDAESSAILFEKLKNEQNYSSLVSLSKSSNIINVDIAKFVNNIIGPDWIEVYIDEIINPVPSFSSAYVGEEVKNGEGDDAITQYWDSPYYQKYVENSSVTAKNFYQDALEYVTYLFVLGYDYVDADGNATEDALKFDLNISKGSDGFVSGITIGGGISITEALKNIKEEYEDAGNFVGITQKNKYQIKRFILEKVIGEKAYTPDDQSTANKNEAIDEVEIKTLENGQVASTEVLKFNRNYDKIVENIISYACEQAPIGKDSETGEDVTLDGAYLASKITDYKGEYFFTADGSDEDGNSVDIFRYIDPAEYQSMVLFPIQNDLGKRLTDIHLGFEYYDYAETLALGLACNQDDGLNLRVGLRYFDCETGTYLFNQSTAFNVKYGLDAVLSEEHDPDYNTVTFTEDDMIGDIVKIEQPFVIDTKFINPLDITPSGDTENSSMLITGNSTAREYYALNNSESGVGFFGALNPEKFKKYNADGSINPNACDYIEVYFDIQKEKGARNVNYNFKVGLKTYYAMSEND